MAESGKIITAGLISAVAACGLNELKAFKQPKVGILSLDPHFAPAGSNRFLQQSPDSNGPLLAALVTRDGGRVMWVDHISNKIEIRKSLSNIDLLLTTGGTYAEKHCEAQLLLSAMGAEILFWGTITQPGGHNGAGFFDSRLVICLSGNPGACAVGYELFAVPILRRFQGLNPNLSRITAICGSDIAITVRKSPRFLRGRATCSRKGWVVEANPGQKAGMIRSLIDCNALIEVPEGLAEIRKGDPITIILLGQ